MSYNTGMWAKSLEYAQQAEISLEFARGAYSLEETSRYTALASAEASLASMWSDLAIKDGL